MIKIENKKPLQYENSFNKTLTFWGGIKESFFSERKMRCVLGRAVVFGAKCAAFRVLQICLGLNALRLRPCRCVWGEMRCISGHADVFGAKCAAFRAVQMCLGRNALRLGPCSCVWGKMRCVWGHARVFGAKCAAFKAMQICLMQNALRLSVRLVGLGPHPGPLPPERVHRRLKRRLF
jgi:hypothetical protein